MQYPDEIIPIVAKIMENFSRIETQRAWDRLGDTFNRYFGDPSTPRVVSDTWKKRFVKFYYRKRLRNILNLIQDNLQIIENNLEYKDLSTIIENIQNKLNSENSELFKFYDQEDKILANFWEYLKENYSEAVTKYKEAVRESKKIKTRKIKASEPKQIDENQVTLNFD